MPRTPRGRQAPDTVCLAIMPRPPSSAWLDQALRIVVRRYRVPLLLHASPAWQESGPATALAAAIEQARTVIARHEAPSAALKRHFVEALAQLIHEDRKSTRLNSSH